MIQIITCDSCLVKTEKVLLIEYSFLPYSILNLSQVYAYILLSLLLTIRKEHGVCIDRCLRLTQTRAHIDTQILTVSSLKATRRALREQETIRRRLVGVWLTSLFAITEDATLRFESLGLVG